MRAFTALVCLVKVNFEDSCATDVSVSGRSNGNRYITYIALVDRRGHRSNRYMFEVWPDISQYKYVDPNCPLNGSTKGVYLLNINSMNVNNNMKNLILILQWIDFVTTESMD